MLESFVVGEVSKQMGWSDSPTSLHHYRDRDRLGERFRNGVVLHTGSHRLRLSDRIVAVPVSTLWGQ